VIDRIPPSLDPVPSVTTLWPPNHKLHPVTIQANAFDNISNIVHLDVEVYSSEPANTQGDGNTMTDYYIDSINDETGLIELWLRAERSGKRNGRTYTIVITATDESDNSSVAEVYVVVPHNRGRSKK
jgi:hypothetical protein